MTTRVNSKARAKNLENFRGNAGVYMVETLVALILGALFAFGLLNMLSETMRLTSSNGNRQAADLIIQTVLDSVKQANPNALDVGTYTLLVNSQTAGERGNAIHPLPVGLNLGDLSWNSKSKGNKFSGAVTLTIQPGSTVEEKVAVVTVSWTDSSNVLTKRIGTLTTMHARGLNLWQ